MFLIIIPILSAFYRDLYWVGEIHGPTDFILFWAFPVVVVILFWRVKQATPGKITISIKIIDAKTGNTSTLGQCIGRYFSYFIAAIPLGLGILGVAFDRRKQGWHDKLADTLVIRDPLLDLNIHNKTSSQQSQHQRPILNLKFRIGLLLILTGIASIIFVIPNYPGPAQASALFLSIWIGLAFFIAAGAKTKKLSPTRYFLYQYF